MARQREMLIVIILGAHVSVGGTDTISQVIRYTYSTIRQKATNRVAIASGAKCEIQKQAVIWCVLLLESSLFPNST